MAAGTRPPAGRPQLACGSRPVVAARTYHGHPWRAVEITDLAGRHGPGRFVYWAVDVGRGLEVWVVPAGTPIRDALDAQVVVHRFAAGIGTAAPVGEAALARLARRAHADMHTPVPSYDEAGA